MAEIRRRGAASTNRVDPELRAPRSKWILERHDQAEHHPVPRSQRMRFLRWMAELQKLWDKPLLVLSLRNLTQDEAVARTVLIAASVEPINRRFGPKGPGCIKCKAPVPVAPESRVPPDWIKIINPMKAPIKLRTLSMACLMCDKCQREIDAAAGVLAQAAISNPDDFAKAILGLIDVLLAPSEGKPDVSEVGGGDEDAVRLGAQG